MRAYERPLAERLIGGLPAIASLTIQGIADRTRFDQRVPTISFRLVHYGLNRSLAFQSETSILSSSKDAG